MSEYSPQADELLGLWNCLSMNMHSAILRARYLQKKAEREGKEEQLEEQLRLKRVNYLYGAVGRLMRSIMSSEGVEKTLPEEEPDGFPRRFIDFRISEDAIPALSGELDRLNNLVLSLVVTLCSIRL